MFARRLNLLCLILLSQTSFSQQPNLSPRAVPESCPVTRPSDKPLVAPYPYPAHAPKGSYWFGTDNLWTLLWTDPKWPMGQKTFWWRQDWGRYKWIPEEQASRLTVTARPLGGNSPPADIAEGRSSYREDWKAFLVGGLNFPTPGCWEIVARYGDDEVTYVVWVLK
jgi:hypothetical protein